jgi:hypothetical protein
MNKGRLREEIQLADVTLSDLYGLVGSQQVHITQLRTALKQALRDNGQRGGAASKEEPAAEG